MISPSSLRTVLYSLLCVQAAQARWQPALLQSDMLSTLTDRFTSGSPRTQTIWGFDNCGLPSDAIIIEGFELSPDPPKPGHELIITASGTVNQLIDEGAYADVVVKLGTFVKILHKQFDICEELRNANATLQCPIQPGHYDIIQTVELPREIPRAKFTVEARAFTQTDDDMACANIMIDFMKPDQSK